MSVNIGINIQRSPNRINQNLREAGALGKYPKLLLDFKDEYYLANGGSKTFENAVTHARAGNATMTDGYGPELVVNGGFDSDSDWTKGTGWTISDGRARADSSSNASVLSQQLSLTGTLVEITVQVYFTSGALQLRFGDNATNQKIITSSGIYTVILEDKGDSILRFYSQNVPVFVGSIDNVSVREMPVIKWAPHNLVNYSDDLTGLGSIAGVTRTANILTETTGTGSHTINIGYVPTVGEKYTVACEVKLESGTRFVSFRGFGEGGANEYPIFNLVNGTVTDSGSSFTDVSITDVGDGYYLLKASVLASSAFSWAIHMQNSATSGSGGYSYTGDGTSAIALRKIRQYRSDLGGMVDNPDNSGNDADFIATSGSAAYLPRIGHHVYNGSAWVNEGLLAESEQRVNLIEYSNDFTDSYWTKSNTPAGGLNFDGTGPDGVADSAVKLIDSSATGTGPVQVQRAITITASTINTFSVYAKKDGLNFLGLRFNNYTTPASAYSVFDLDAGTVAATNADHTALIQDVGNGWYRISITSTFSTDTSGEAVIRLFEDASTSLVNLDGTSSVFIYGAQFEEGSTPSSFCPTNGQQCTKEAETFTIPSANLPWSGTAVSIGMEGRVTFADENSANTHQFYNWSADGSNVIRLFLNTNAGTGQVDFVQAQGGTFDATLSGGSLLSPDVFVPFNTASRHGSTFINGAVDGVALTEKTTPTALPDLSSTDLELAYQYMGTISEFRVWDKDITDAGLVEATNPSLEPSLSLTFEGTGTNSFTVSDWSE